MCVVVYPARMYALGISILFGAGFVHVMRFAQLRKLNMAWIGAINYLTASVCCGLIWATQPNAPSGWPPVVFGLLGGVVFTALYFLLTAGFEMVGAGIVQCATRISIVIPVAAAVMVFDREIPSLMRILGIALALAAFPFLSRTHALANPVHSQWKGLVLFALFLLNGSMGVLWKWYAQYVPVNGSAAILTFVFGVAFLGTLVAALRGRTHPTGDGILHGVALGLVNVAACSAAVAAIAMLKGALFFPVNAIALILLTMIMATLLWKERFGKPALIGLALAIVAIALIFLEECVPK